MARADDLATTDAELACLNALREATGTTDDPMERHCERQFLTAERMATDRGLETDRELLPARPSFMMRASMVSH